MGERVLGQAGPRGDAMRKRLVGPEPGNAARPLHHVGHDEMHQVGARLVPHGRHGSGPGKAVEVVEHVYGVLHQRRFRHAHQSHPARHAAAAVGRVRVGDSVDDFRLHQQRAAGVHPCLRRVIHVDVDQRLAVGGRCQCRGPAGAVQTPATLRPRVGHRTSSALSSGNGRDRIGLRGVCRERTAVAIGGAQRRGLPPERGRIELAHLDEASGA